jgi:hypothetical protein
MLVGGDRERLAQSILSEDDLTDRYPASPTMTAAAAAAATGAAVPLRGMGGALGTGPAGGGGPAAARAAAQARRAQMQMADAFAEQRGPWSSASAQTAAHVAAAHAAAAHAAQAQGQAAGGREYMHAQMQMGMPPIQEERRPAAAETNLDHSLAFAPDSPVRHEHDEGSS